ncbi:primosomal protein N' [Candidatus Endolissoclinum faulkneri L5]|uniref:Replication restart protein PriA n=1 Tax=Candidatus Endolissoclinum faulkneri L5 TaxID=1401328 RepID=V9TSU0_9PROT|nr:primosomal protein N' [Candidatus Endolissoclinum faulkneri]AHC73989.1 primosomal protein N' [Candidatus Endolissoclinum faulkneri L5]
MHSLLPLNNQSCVVSVLLPLPLNKEYHYNANPMLELNRGDLVEVPFSRRRLLGVVLSLSNETHAELKRLRWVIRRFDLLRLPKNLIDLVEWTASWTLAPRGSVLRMVLSTPSAFDSPKSILFYALASQENRICPKRLTNARRRVLSVFNDCIVIDHKNLLRKAVVGSRVIKSMVESGILDCSSAIQYPIFEPPDITGEWEILNTEQQKAVKILSSRINANRFSVTAVEGIKGSGKTEVYFRAIAETLAAGKQVLVLLPEIVFSSEWLERFTDRFAVKPAVWHSALQVRVRRDTWRAVAKGSVRVLFGARSALFLPFNELGLIVVDEEHESYYKQDVGVVYHARDMAVVRARLEGIPIILVSTTLSLETVENVRQGRYTSIHLAAFCSDINKPEVALIDLRKYSLDRGNFLSQPLIQAMQNTLDKGEQSMLFINRRGYAPLTLCNNCGHRLKCSKCTAWLVMHQMLNQLICHYCGLSTSLPKCCPLCNIRDSFIFSGPGVERLAEEMLLRFPDVKFQIASSDTVKGPNSTAELVRSMQSKEINVVISTQSIFKGYNFPFLTLVGVVDADLGLTGCDPRACERTYQLLHQVVGHVGGASRPAKILVQTLAPENPVMQAIASGDRESFLRFEINQRKAFGMPPYGKLAAIVISSLNLKQVDEVAQLIAKAMPRLNGVIILGPIPAPIAVIRCYHRRRFIVRADRKVNIQKVLRDWLAAIRPKSSVRIKVDVDPYNFM